MIYRYFHQCHIYPPWLFSLLIFFTEQKLLILNKSNVLIFLNRFAFGVISVISSSNFKSTLFSVNLHKWPTLFLHKVWGVSWGSFCVRICVCWMYNRHQLFKIIYFTEFLLYLHPKCFGYYHMGLFIHSVLFHWYISLSLRQHHRVLILVAKQ